MHRRIIGISALAISACFLAPGFAATIIAVGAGSTPATAEDLTGTFPTEIIGTLSGTNQNDVDLLRPPVPGPELPGPGSVDHQ